MQRMGPEYFRPLPDWIVAGCRNTWTCADGLFFETASQLCKSHIVPKVLLFHQ